MVGVGWLGRAKQGLSVDDEKQQKARRRDVSRFEQDKYIERAEAIAP